MCALMALLLFHCHSPVSYVHCSKCTTLIFNSLFLPLSTTPECSLVLSPAFCYPSLIPLSLLPKRVLKCHCTDAGVCGTVRRTYQKCHSSLKFGEWGGVINVGSITSSIPCQWTNMQCLHQVPSEDQRAEGLNVGTVLQHQNTLSET